MKRSLFLLTFVLSIFAGAIFFQSCETEPPIPPCERDNVGTVTVKNSTGYSVWVDVTWGNVVENYEKLLYNGNTYKYNNIPAGGIEIWVSFDNDDWYYEYENLSACEDMTFTWYLNARKSTGSCPFILLVNGEEVQPILKTKNLN